jgi:hypothetical protein
VWEEGERGEGRGYELRERGASREEGKEKGREDRENQGGI